MIRKTSLILLLSTVLILMIYHVSSAAVYTIQTGLFKVESNARKQVKILKAHYPDAEPFIVRKGSLFLVKTGRFRTRAEAEAVLPVIRKVSRDAYIEKITPSPGAGSGGEASPEVTDKAGLEGTLVNIRKLVLKGKYDEAIASIKPELQRHPESHELHGWYGTVLLKSGDPEAALPWFRKAMYLNKTIPEYHNGAGYCLLATGRLYEALEEFSRALKLKPDYDDALAGLGYVYIGLGMKNEALTVYNRLKKVNQEMADLLFRRLILM